MDKDQIDLPVVAVSACLLGWPVRYDAQHRYNNWIADALGEIAMLIPFCPEVEAGLGVPRKTIELFRNSLGLVSLRLSESGQEVIAIVEKAAKARSQTLGRKISGLIVKKNSPSCGRESVPVFDPFSKSYSLTGEGVFVSLFRQDHPLLPIEDEERLKDRSIAENFLIRVYVLHRWRQSPVETMQGLIEFHARHKLLLMAHDPDAYHRLGNMVSKVTQTSLIDIRDAYMVDLMNSLSSIPSPGRHINVLQHIVGYFKNNLGRDEKKSFQAMLEGYRQGEVPFVHLLMKIRSYLQQIPNFYLRHQYYLFPFPDSVFKVLDVGGE